ncbi:C6 transcription factor [Aspergillus sclerotioniger CBS 115572]|uniref:C6 transcription factor n=1 Tax=Aspergillus sclerotioniger CBS 115572 TaxID=1450535 RepID=A0A317V4T6_9EURO|nr:C6 transcription factor [Aspergillus sclerotioniger CBS 115572]PWY68088.1 C6 transcription factor [Aspergillus sclerotioniger CBS 115572]
MVYRGRPSRSWRECRRRDIICDKNKDSCSQCAHAGLSCSGYPNSTDLIILDETPATVEKVLKKRALQRQSSPNPLSTKPPPTVFQRAKYVYISQYVEDAPATGLFSYMQVFYPSRSEDFHLLETVINTMFMATFSSLQGHQPALYHARVGYGSAFSLTRRAIQSPKEAVLDRTLFSILLMSVFERLANSERQRSNLRNNHLQDALELISLSGNGHFTDEGYHDLVILDCLANEVDVPPRFLSLRQMALWNGADTSSLRWRFLEVMLEYAQTQSIAPEHLDQLSKHLPSFVSRRQGPQPLNSSATWSDTYPDYNTQRCWNNIRVVRIQLAKVIREQCAQLLGGSTDDGSVMEELHSSNQPAVSLSSDICLSVPCKSATAGIQSSTLLFHLHVAKEIISGPAELRLFIPKRLQYSKERQPPSQDKSWDGLLYDPHNKPRNVWNAWLRIGKEDYSI